MHFNGMTRLKILGVANTRVTIAGLARLRAADGLESLQLGHNRLTDSDLVLLSGMKSLKGIGVRRTYVTKSGISTIKQSFPDLDSVPSPSASPADQQSSGR